MADFLDNFLDDTQIPNVFISDYMSELSFPALKVYLMAQFKGGYDVEILSVDCARSLGMREEDMQAAILELASRELVEAEHNLESFKIVDLKRKTVERYYRRKTSKSMTEIAENNGNSDRRQNLINSINDTYFQGMMGPSWYQSIDSWFEDYGFDETVVYQMVKEAAERNKLNGPNYLSAMAKDYARNAVKSYEDLVRYKENNKLVRHIANQVGKTLNKRMSKYDFELVEKWVNDFGYDFDVIEVALRAAVRLSEPNLNYFDKILSNWHEAGIKTQAEAENLLNNNKRARQAKSRVASTRKNPSIDEREYDEDYLMQFVDFKFQDEQGDDANE